MAIATMDYIDVDDKGVARIAGSRSKVMQVVMDTMNGMAPREIHEAYPHLSLAQIHAALAYYYDHQAELDAKIQASIEFAERMSREEGESPVVKRFREQGLLP